MTYENSPITSAWTVNDVMRCFPMSILVFNNLGIDTCCGATATLDAAAAKAGMSADKLLAALEPCSTDELIPPDETNHPASCRMHSGR